MKQPRKVPDKPEPGMALGHQILSVSGTRPALVSVPDHGHLQSQDHCLVYPWQSSGGLAKKLIKRALLPEGCWHNPPVLHSDNGAPMTSYTLKARLADLGIFDVPQPAEGQ